MKKILVLLLIILCSVSTAFAAKIPEDVQTVIKKSFPTADIRFDGEACAISTSATSIMIRSLIGKSVEEVEKIIDNYQKMINEEKYDEELLGELNVYDHICKQPNRKGCALLPSVAISGMLKENKDEN